MKERKTVDPYKHIRRPTAPPTVKHIPKKKYNRKKDKRKILKEIEEWTR